MLGNVRKHTMSEAAAVVVPKTKKPTEYRESHHQREVVKWIRKRDNWLVMRMENAAKRTGAQYARDEAMGMEPGAPDLLVMFHTFGFYLEMKEPNGRVSEVQEKLHKQLRSRGCAVLIGWGHEATTRTLEKIEAHWSHYGDTPSLCAAGLKSLITQGSIKHV